MQEKFGLHARLVNRASFEAEQPISRARNRFFLRRLKDPIPKLNPELLYRQVQFVVGEGDWYSRGEEVAVDIIR